MKQVYLSELEPCTKGRIQRVLAESSKKNRLYELGMLPGHSIECAFIAPSGSPMAFWIKDALIALRTRECGKIVVCIDE